MTELTQRVLRCRETGEGYDELVREICLITYQYPHKKYGWDEDECGDFFCSLLRRIPGLINRFRYTGVQFESYFYKTLKWQMKTFSEKRHKQAAYDRVLSAPLFSLVQESPDPFLPDSYTDIPADISRHLKINRSGIIRDRASCIRILCMTLRNCEFVDDIMIHRVSRLCGCTPDWLGSCVTHLRSRMDLQRTVVTRLQARRSQLFLRKCLLQDSLNRENNPDTKKKLSEELDAEQNMLTGLNEQIGRYPLYPTHREIAQVLGLPKGSVDSGIYYLKNTFHGLSQSSSIRYA